MSSGVFNRAPRTILFVDDDVDTLIAYECLATDEGFAVVAARDGYTAIALVETVIPDLVVLDLWLPGLDGFDIARRLRGHPRTRDIPIVLVSGDDSPATQAAAKEIGCERFLAKPISGDDLIRAANTLVARRRGNGAYEKARMKSR